MYYFASDTHFGMDVGTRDSLSRERLMVRWLEEVSVDAKAIFLMGDIFDFWFEYNRVVPKGCTRFLGKLSELTDRGIKIHLFVGNHDLWVHDYLFSECGVEIHTTPEIVSIDGKTLLLAHGDNLMAKGLVLRAMNGLFRSRTARWFFQRLVHPDLALRFGQAWSQHSRLGKGLSHKFLGEEESMVKYAREQLKSKKIDFFIFGHNHIALDFELGGSSRVIFLGEWIDNPSYATFDGGEMRIEKYVR